MHRRALDLLVNGKSAIVDATYRKASLRQEAFPYGSLAGRIGLRHLARNARRVALFRSSRNLYLAGVRKETLG